jgi:hypothetical protein
MSGGAGSHGDVGTLTDHDIETLRNSKLCPPTLTERRLLATIDALKDELGAERARAEALVVSRDVSEQGRVKLRDERDALKAEVERVRECRFEHSGHAAIKRAEAAEAERDELRDIVKRAAECSINTRGENAGKALKFMRAYDAYQEKHR